MDVLALSIAFVALVVAVASAFYTKRQADAAHGNLDPVVTLKLYAAGPFGQPLDVICTNRNVAPIFLTRCKFDVPAGVNVMHKRSPRKDELSGPESDVRLPFPVLIEPDAPPSRFVFALVPSDPNTNAPRYELSVTCWFRVGSRRWKRKASAFATVDARKAMA